MNLSPITMDRTLARKAFLEYRASARKLLDRELDTLDAQKADVLARQRVRDEALMRGYRLLSLGRQIIDLNAVLIAGGEDELHRPKLAVARADSRTQSLIRFPDGSVRFGDWTQRGDRWSRSRRVFSLPAAAFPRLPNSNWVYATATVPLIPPALRPDSLDQFTILWEAEWTSRPPVDPALLRSLGGGLYAVVAVWDLTELEQIVLGMTARR